MERWEDQGIVLAARPHGEGGAVVSVLTAGHGRHAGYVRGAHSARMREALEPGTLVDVVWQARIADQLGAMQVEAVRGYAARLLDDGLRLGALQAACALCDSALPEREGHAGLFHGLVALFEALESEVWGAAYVIWEIALLRELGFSLDLQNCAGGGDSRMLAYVSPRTGRAVSYQAGEGYRDRLLPLPSFLKPNGDAGDAGDVLAGLRMTGHFMEQWVFAHHSAGVPPARLRFEARFAKHVDHAHQQDMSRDHDTG